MITDYPSRLSAPTHFLLWQSEGFEPQSTTEASDEELILLGQYLDIPQSAEAALLVF